MYIMKGFILAVSVSLAFMIALYIGHQWAKSDLKCEHNPSLVRAKVVCTLTPQLSEVMLIDNLYSIGDTIYRADSNGDVDYNGLQFIVLEKEDVFE